MRKLSHQAFAVAFAMAISGLGVVSLVSREFAYLWQPTPTWAVGHSLLAAASGALLLACGLGLLWPRALARSSLVLGLYGIASIVLVHAPRIAMAPRTEVEWFNLGEIATVVAGAWILFADVAQAPADPWRRAIGGERGIRCARLLFGVALPMFGLSHFVYASTTAGMVPAFLPGHFAWAYLTGAAHIAAGLAILLGFMPRLAATLEGLMVSTFLLAVNLPDLVKTSGRQAWPWTELFVAAAIGGVAFLVAQTYRDQGWSSIRLPGSTLPPSRQLDLSE